MPCETCSRRCGSRRTEPILSAGRCPRPCKFVGARLAKVPPARLGAQRRMKMRKYLLASAFALGAVGTIGSAFAQAGPSPLQGQLVAPPGAVPGANNNNNSFGTARPGAAAVPTPGTLVIHLNARVTVEYVQAWNSVTNQAVPAVGAGSGFKASGNEMAMYARLYPGVDGMAANGLRYGAAIEIRNNFGAPTTGSNNNPG